MVPNKGRYLVKDLNRLASYMNVPLRQPSNTFEVMFEKGSLAAMRFITAVAESAKDGDHLVEFLEKCGSGSGARVRISVSQRLSVRNNSNNNLLDVAQAGLKAGLSFSEVEELIRLAQAQPVKDKLKQTTQQALDYKAFGFPLIICHVDGKPEAFFGSDRFELMARCIGEKWLGPQPDKLTSNL